MRKRTVAVMGLLTLILGFLLGSVFPQSRLPWGVEEPDGTRASAVFLPEPPPSPGESSSSADTEQSEEKPALNPKENFPLLNAACAVVRLIQQRNYAGLSAYVHPDRGLTLTPYSTVNPVDDLTFTAAQVAAGGHHGTPEPWGRVPGPGELIQMTPEEFFSAHLAVSDYTQASRIGVDQVNISGNALENVAEAYPGCRFVDFTCPGSGAANQGQDWSALKLVFLPEQDHWLLVGLVHSQWTV